ncbi:MAG: DUF488 domain-containing protein [Bdellovibrionota bacterium]
MFTIGHSSRSEAEFLHLLEAHQIEVLVDVRSLPGSRRFPQFNRERLQSSLKKIGIRYLHFPGLGGRRPATKNSKNLAWRVAAFRNYADYMETDIFKKSLKRLILLAKKKRVVVMCAEALPWRCHRRLIADAVIAKGLPVFDIMTKTSAVPHELPPWARIRSGKLGYPETSLRQT